MVLWFKKCDPQAIQNLLELLDSNSCQESL